EVGHAERVRPWCYLMVPGVCEAVFRSAHARADDVADDNALFSVLGDPAGEQPVGGIRGGAVAFLGHIGRQNNRDVAGIGGERDIRASVNPPDRLACWSVYGKLTWVGC
ncbi:hypothetical protein, partial [Escherichia coli]|uniref:hypothetical protein n=1 Tax=Escherichia coli TaxID=562 RepID=UPI001D09A575